jgi:hypothetical protein
MTLRAANLARIAALFVASALPCVAATLPPEFLPSSSAQTLPASDQSVVIGLALLSVFLVLYVSYRLSASFAGGKALEPRKMIVLRSRGTTLPATAQVIRGFDICSSYSPSREFGGDFFQTIRLDGRHKGSVLLVIGDVSGKGNGTSMAVSRIALTINSLVEDFGGPGKFLAQLNSRIQGRLNSESATCVAVHLDSRGHCTVASAGHPAPIVNGRELELAPAFPLGILRRAEFPEREFALGVEDYLVLHSNGVTEARNESGEMFGDRRLENLLSQRPSAQQVMKKAVDFGQTDDVTVLTVARLRTPDAWVVEPTVRLRTVSQPLAC